MPASGERERLTALFLLLLLILALGAVILWQSPRHRSFYRTLLGTTDPSIARGTEQAPPSSIATGAPQGERRPLPSAKDAGSRPGKSSDDRVVISVVERPPSKLPAGGVPYGWTLKQFSGDPSVESRQEGGRVVLRLASQKSSFALYRDVTVDLREFPLLTWSWKVTALPERGDVRSAAADDQAAQVYVIFPHWPFPRAASDVLGYVWDSRAPVGLALKSGRAENVRLIVVESGAEKLGRWLTVTRNVAHDYRALFGKEPSTIGRVAIMTDSNDTGSAGEVLFSDLTFLKLSPGSSSLRFSPPLSLRFPRPESAQGA